MSLSYSILPLESLTLFRDMPSELQEHYLGLHGCIVGPAEACSHEAPVKEGGEWVKGTQFECLVLSKGLKPPSDHKRIYAITQSQQAQNGVLSPNLEAKSFQGDDGEEAAIRRELAKVCLFVFLFPPQFGDLAFRLVGSWAYMSSALSSQSFMTAWRGRLSC